MTTKRKARRHDRPWTPHDLQHMRVCANKRISARLAAKALGRTPGSVKYKAMEQGVRFRSINQPRGVQQRPALRRKLARLRRARAA